MTTNCRLREELEQARAELAAVKQERDRLDAATRRLSEESAAATCKLAALRERESVPVKVRWSVTSEQVRADWKASGLTGPACYQWAMDYLAAHAVIDAPAGVPSVEELTEVGCDAQWERMQFDADEDEQEKARATAIRDAVMAGGAGGCDQCGEYEAVRKMHAACVDARDAALLRVEYLERLYGHKEGELRGPLQAELEMKQKDIDRLRDELDARDIEDATAAPTAAQVEALAKVLENEWTAEHRSAKAAHKAQARAAFAHFDAVPVQSVDPDAWKTPLEIAIGRNSITLSKRDNSCCVSVGGDGSYKLVFPTPETAASMSLWLASYAAAHGCPVSLPAPERPNRLPTRDELRAIMDKNMLSYPGWCTWQHIEAVVDYLATYLREPVGWELDVHPDQLDLYKWVTMPDGGYAYAAQQALDLCRSRIRPVYECKECAARREHMMKPQPEIRCAQCVAFEKECIQMRNANNELVRRADAARAALEGE